MWILGGGQPQQQLFLLLPQSQIGLMGTLLGRFAIFFPQTPNRCFTLYIQPYSLHLLIKDKCSVAFQMRLGTTFGAFLDPVADKVGLSLLITLSWWHS